MNNRKLLTLTNEQKAEICRYKRDNSDFSNIKIARHFEKIFKLNPHDLKPTTISGILKKSEVLLNTDFGKNQKFRIKNAENPQLEEQRSVNIPISDKILQEKAKEFGSPEYFGLRDFNFSDGWLHRFKQRYHLRLHIICGESGDISSKTIEIERERLKKIMRMM